MVLGKDNNMHILESNNKLVHINHSRYVQSDVYFTPFNRQTREQILQESDLMNCSVIMSTILKPGHMDKPNYHKSMEELIEDCHWFFERGKLIMWHGYLNTIHEFKGDPDNYVGLLVGYLEKDIDENTRQIKLVDHNFGDEWKHFTIKNKAVPNWGTPFHQSYYSIDGEIIWCSNDSIRDNIMYVYRGSYQTEQKPHRAGTPVYYRPCRNGFYIDENSPLQYEYSQLMRLFAQEAGISMWYFDGFAYTNTAKDNLESSIRNNYIRGIHPYTLPGLYAFGGAVCEDVENRVRWMAAAPEPLSFTGSHLDMFDAKLDKIFSGNDYKPYSYDFGWCPLPIESDAIGYLKNNFRCTWQASNNWNLMDKDYRKYICALIGETRDKAS